MANAAANGLVIFAAIYFDWRLLEVTLAYAGELVILMVFVYARIIAATRGNAGESATPHGWQLWIDKMVAILITLPFYFLVVGLVFLLMFGVPTGGFEIDLPMPTSRWLALCWLAFFLSHALAFGRLASVGAYRTLISEGRLMLPLLRYPPLLIAAIGVSSVRAYGVDTAPWFFILVLAMMACVNTIAHFVETDALRATDGLPEEAAPAE